MAAAILMMNMHGAVCASSRDRTIFRYSEKIPFAIMVDPTSELRWDDIIMTYQVKKSLSQENTFEECVNDFYYYLKDKLSQADKGVQIKEDNKKNTYVQQSPSEKHLLPKHDVNSIKIYKAEDVYTSTRCFEETTINAKHSYTEEELNDLSYDMAILYDTRTFCSLYGNYLKYKQPILNAFIVKTDTTLKSVKIAMLFLSVAMSFSFNALFFTESIQNKNYETNGNLSFLVTLPKVILSCVASVIISTILSLISSFDSKIKSIKNETNKEDLKQRVPTYINSIKCKLTVFFVIMSILMLFFWYFVSAFCSVYPKYQKIWLTDSLKSLGLTMFFPFLYALGVTIFRYIGIKKKSSCSFCFAKVINII